MTTNSAAAPREVDLATVRRAVAGSAMGNAVEWYDYGVFTSGALVSTIGNQFYPGGEATFSFVLLAISFLFRPLGGAVFGPLGDKLGRQKVLAVTILMMSGGTFLVGALPSYAGPYSFGIGATILIIGLRVIQGFSTGGEYGGAATFICEYAPTKRRGFFGSFLEFGTLGGYVLGQSVVLIVSLSMSHDSFTSWGWRLPFMVALPLGLIGLYLRTKLEDTPAFEALSESGGVSEKAPFLETLREHWRMILNLIGIVLLLNIADYILLTTMPSYFTNQLHLGDTESSLVIIGVELVQMALIAPVGALSDRIGRRPIMLTSAVGFIVLSYPAFALMQSGQLWGLILGFLIVALLLLGLLAVIGSTFPAMFPCRVRYSSFAIGYNLSTSLFGGTAGLVVTKLIKVTGSNNIPAYYLMLAGLIGLIPLLLIPETARVPLDQVDNGGAWRRGQTMTPVS